MVDDLDGAVVVVEDWGWIFLDVSKFVEYETEVLDDFCVSAGTNKFGLSGTVSHYWLCLRPIGDDSSGKAASISSG